MKISYGETGFHENLDQQNFLLWTIIYITKVSKNAVILCGNAIYVSWMAIVYLTS